MYVKAVAKFRKRLKKKENGAAGGSFPKGRRDPAAGKPGPRTGDPRLTARTFRRWSSTGVPPEGIDFGRERLRQEI